MCGSRAKMSSTTKFDDGDFHENNSKTITDKKNEEHKIVPRRRRSPIAILPKIVVDQIAAGEVVQRPVSVVKELIENSLDAGATHIVVQFDGLKKITIIDNGKGIPRSDLPLLCTRHATSKITSVDDFSELSTFGFRGEALASTSMVSRLLTVVSRVRADNNDGLAYSQSYRNGKPTQPKANPCASKIGTKITIEDLFYNVLHRQQAYSKRENEEYGRIHKIVQDYAIHYPTVGFVCQRASVSKGNYKRVTVIVDCNTGQIPAVKKLLQSRDSAAAATANPTEKLSTLSQDSNDTCTQDRQQRHKTMVMEATKQVLSHVLESNVADHLLYMECTQDAHKPLLSSTSPSDLESSSSRYKFMFMAQMYFTSPSYNNNNNNNKKNGSGNNKRVNNKQSQGKFVIFLNHRLVDIPPLKRALEDVYSDFGNSKKTSKPILVVNLKVPGAQVDVNVHPSKRQVALMFQEDLVSALSQKLRQRLEEHGQIFVAQSVVVRNPYADEQKNKKRKRSLANQKSKNDDEKCDDAKIMRSDQTKNIKKSKTSESKLAPSKMIRTNTAARSGAIEPFLVSTQRSSQQPGSTQFGNIRNETPVNQSVLHVSTCPLSKPFPKIDFSLPGAFAIALKQEKCTCPTDEARRTVLVKKNIVRPKRVVPTKSKYASIASLRKRVVKQQCSEITQEIRTSFFMGVLSNQRSLIQAGEQLVMINHFELAKELFYQLALASFGDCAKAYLGAASNSGIHIQQAIAQALQFEELLQCDEQGDGSLYVGTGDGNRGAMIEVNDTNNNLAHQATSRLIESAEMLEEYFSIRIEIRNSDEERTNNGYDATANAVLTCLPILLDGHQPQQCKYYYLFMP